VHHWAIATPDALTTDLEPVEVKNLSHGYDPEGWAEQIPEKYYLQCQHQMLVMGAERCLFGALLWGSKLLWEWVPRDEFTIRRIIRAGSEFWGHIERREPPPSDGHPNARKALARRATDPEPVELYESEIGALLEQWFEAAKASQLADATAKKAKRQRDALADELAKHLGDHVSGMTATGWSVRWKTIERRGYEVAPATIKQLEIKPPKMRK
jgi:predicted phage-related endonuclease